MILHLAACPISGGQYTAANLCVVLKVLEDKNCAHCDICSNNVIVDPKRKRVELIDIEDMFGPGFGRNPHL